MSVTVNETENKITVTVNEVNGKDGDPGQDYQTAEFTDFTGELNVSGDFQPYNDYSGAEISTLTFSTEKKRGATGFVRIKGGSIAVDAIPAGVTLMPFGASITTDITQWNQIDYQYLSDTVIRMVLTNLDSNFQPVESGTVTEPTPTNTAPVTVADSYSVDENTTLNVAAPGLLGNDTDADADSLTAVKVSEPANGTATVNADGSFSYTPNADFFGSDSFTYKTNDGTVDGNTETVSITVNEVGETILAPNQLTNAYIWYDGGDAANMTVDGSNVVQSLTNKISSSVLNIIAGTPTYIPAENVIRFNSAGENIQSASNLAALNKADSFTLFTIFKANNAPATGLNGFLVNSIDANDRVCIGIRDGKIGAGYYNGSTWITKGGNFSDTTSFHVIEYQNNAGTVTAYLDGVELTETAVPLPNASDNKFRMGGATGIDTSYDKAHIHGTTSVISAGERTNHYTWINNELAALNA